MPRVWMAIPIGGTAPLVAPVRDQPERLRELIENIVRSEGAELENLFFDVDRPVAYALVKELDDFIGIRAVFRLLGVQEAVKVLDVGQVAEALGREQTIRGRVAPGSEGGQ